MTGLPSFFAPRRSRRGSARRQHALGVVGQHHGAGARQQLRARCLISAASISASTGSALSQSARSRCVEMMLGDEAHLARRRARRIDHQMRLDQRLVPAERVLQRRARRRRRRPRRRRCSARRALATLRATLPAPPIDDVLAARPRSPAPAPPARCATRRHRRSRRASDRRRRGWSAGRCSTSVFRNRTCALLSDSGRRVSRNCVT